MQILHLNAASKLNSAAQDLEKIGVLLHQEHVSANVLDMAEEFIESLSELVFVDEEAQVKVASCN